MIKITQPNYKECYIDNTLIPGDIVFNNKIFHNDTCIFHDNTLTLIESKRSEFFIGGVLKLTNNIYYKDPKSNKYLYEFYPINWRYPKFMVKSEIKNNLMKRKEKIEDQFIVIQFKEWTNKYPIGTTYKVIGETHTILHMNEILFYYHPEQPYIPPQKMTLDKVNNSTNNELSIIHDFKLDTYNISEVDQIYSIDPPGCKDIDDALSYDHKNKRIGIHIADVNYTIDTLDLTFNKYSTIYAPHKHLNMIPDELAYNYCSLLVGKTRPVITCWIRLDTMNVTFERHFIVVKYNLNYDTTDKYMNNPHDPSMLSMDEIKLLDTLQKLYNFSIELNTKYKFIENVENSHDMVQIYMIYLNQYVGLLLKDKDIIYRNQIFNKSAEYSYENNGHISMNVNYYTHFTSPIRRIVDQYIHKVLINEYFDTKTKSKITKLDVQKINEFEFNLKKVTILWNYLTVSYKIKNGHKYTLEFCGFEESTQRVEFKLLEYKIFINNKIFYTVIDEKTICIQNKNYELNEIYELPLYIINESKNQYFPKIFIKF